MWRIKKIKKNQERTAELAVKTLMITMVMEEDGSEQETKLIIERQVKMTASIQKYQTYSLEDFDDEADRPMLRC